MSLCPCQEKALGCSSGIMWRFQTRSVQAYQVIQSDQLSSLNVGGHLTIPKRAQRLARKIYYRWYSNAILVVFRAILGLCSLPTSNNLTSRASVEANHLNWSAATARCNPPPSVWFFPCFRGPPGGWKKIPRPLHPERTFTPTVWLVRLGGFMYYLRLMSN